MPPHGESAIMVETRKCRLDTLGTNELTPKTAVSWSNDMTVHMNETILNSDLSKMSFKQANSGSQQNGQSVNSFTTGNGYTSNQHSDGRHENSMRSSDVNRSDQLATQLDNISFDCDTNDTKIGRVEAIDHVTFWVGNAKQAASFYMTQFGFEPFAFRGLETGTRDLACHVVRLNEAIIQFVSPVEPNNVVINEFITRHGDAIKDIAFEVTNIEHLLQHVLSAGAELVHELETVYVQPTCDSPTGKEHRVKRATIKTFGDVTHTFIERNYEYSIGKFLPGYQKPSLKLAPAFANLPVVPIQEIDHIVGQFPPNKLDEITEWYSRVLNFRRYWSVDEKQIFTDHSGVKSHVMTNYNEKVKMPLCEVTLSKIAKSKAEEFVRYNYGSGIHHIALRTNDIVAAVAHMRERGMDFLHTPDTYYSQLKERLKECAVNITQDIERLRELKILVDFDEQGYLLQIFTRPVQDRPTLVFEIIQRFNHDGFGAGNFLALFKAIEAETALRGNL
ncbi:4-hydroxyphenylpyruvate dioxygenase [Fragariocoptes setiger]|uniref:4-hydroxyphenylpyruvate dioxygenase n=1 Tax=Fragariocoptes setiger TaxID=1670756 RepID=A0ABQ7SCC9_9ACAR|nr:4-hydroxyphenylpyruvate dioxygenase [Fragariocoptes setiger]